MAQGAAYKMHYVGTPVRQIRVSAAMVGQDGVYFATTGSPPWIVEESASGQIMRKAPLPAGYQVWGIAQAADGTVYASTASGGRGYLYAWPEGSAEVRQATVIQGVDTLWQLSVDPTTGIVWIGTHPCGLYAYNPANGQVADYTQQITTAAPGCADVHAVGAYGGTVYAGVMPKPAVIEFNPATGAAETVSADPNTSGVEAISASASEMTVEYSDQNSFVYSTQVQPLPSANTMFSSAFEYGVAMEGGFPVALGGRDYVVTSTGIGSFMDAPQPCSGVQCYVSPTTGNPQGLIWLPWRALPGTGAVQGVVNGSPAQELPGSVLADGVLQGSLVAALKTGQVATVDPTAAASASASPQGIPVADSAPQGLPVAASVAAVPQDFPAAPAVIHSLFAASDGSLWVGAYPGGEVARLARGALSRHQFGQADSFTDYGGILYIGDYPGARLALQPESAPWVTANSDRWTPLACQPPQPPGQQVPFTQTRAYGLAASPLGVYFGTAPEPGHLNGALCQYDAAKGTLDYLGNPVPGEAITSLTFAGKYLIGATTAFGGAGATPVHKSGRVFVWDPTTNQLVTTLSPVPGLPVWGGLIDTPYGVFGANEEALFRMDPATLRITGVRRFASGSLSGDTWAGLTHMLSWHGYLFLLTGGHLYAVNPWTLAVKRIEPSIYSAVGAFSGNTFYFAARETQLWGLPAWALVAAVGQSFWRR